MSHSSGRDTTKFLIHIQLQTPMQEVLSLSLGRKTGFSPPLEANSGITPSLGHDHCLPNILAIHYTSISLPFEDTYTGSHLGFQ
jgi:hypothetical protein